MHSVFFLLFCRIDATENDGSLGRFVNDDHRRPNAIPKKCNVDGPCIVFIALRDILPDDEITFNYCSTKKETFSWRITEK